MTAILYLHGGGHADHTRYTSLIERFATVGITGHAFDHHATTLAGRIDEAEQELAKLKSRYELADIDIYVWGSSMGGHIASRLTATHPNLAGLILQSAAAYSQTAETIAFGPDFTAELHRNNSWQDSLAFQDLTKYQGKVCLIYWQHDDVVPSGVIKKYFDSIGAKVRSLTIPGAGHSMLRPRNEHERRGWEQMYDYSLSFIQGKV